MSIVAENKRRAFASLATLIVLIALGFAVGRATSGPAAATAASRSIPSNRVPVASGDSSATPLKADLGKRQQAQLVPARHLAQAQAVNRQLSHAAATAKRETSRARRCQHIHAPRRFRQCVSTALSR